MDQDPAKAGQPLTGPAWRDIAKMTTWPNPAIPRQPIEAPWEWQKHQQPAWDCDCASCQHIRRQQMAPEAIHSQLQNASAAISTLMVRAKSQDARIAKLEELVKMLTKALGVNEEFLSDAFKGAV